MEGVANVGKRFDKEWKFHAAKPVVEGGNTVAEKTRRFDGSPIFSSEKTYLSYITQNS
jgi:hypothetical protein